MTSRIRSTRARDRRLSVAALTALSLCFFAAPAVNADTTGILLLAHGGAKTWNAQVTDLAARVNEQAPTEVAFGMADRSTMQAAIDRLIERGVSTIVAVPLFVSSHSSVFESSEFLLGARSEAPADLQMFARMKHGPEMAAGAPHHGEGAAESDGTRPVTSSVPIRVSHALDHDPVVAAILTTRAQSISRTPASEVLIVVAHGPTSDEENRLWVKDMQIVAGGISQAVPFARVESLTVRDDAPTEMRDQAAKELRETVTRAQGEGHRVLIVPLLLAYGGIEAGVKKRLDGLDYQIATQGLLPDDRLAQWVLDSARAR